MHGTHPNKPLTIGEAKKIIGGSLSFPTKLPGTSYGLPARECILGKKLAQIKGTVCSGCYALADHYSWPNPVKAQYRRLASLTDPRWVGAMVRLLLHYHSRPFIMIDTGKVRLGPDRWRPNPTGYHRWNDSGDLQSVKHFAMICEVARLTPKIRHWLPTQELGFVRQYLRDGGAIPSNLLVRVSSVMIDDPVRRSWPTTSEVFADNLPADAHICPAPQQDHQCGSCRACWSSEVPHVAYAQH
jgi:hypothetical protein